MIYSTKKITATAIAILVMILSFTNADAQKDVNGMIGAEKEFAAFTSTHTIKEGFLKYMDSAGIVFSKASPVNALEVYQKQKPSPGYLNWAPAMAVISASGDVGVTTGPYEYRATAADSVIGRGNFSSIWQISKEGVWKNLVDLGTSYDAPVSIKVNEVKKITIRDSQNTGTTYEELMAMDQKLNCTIHQKNTTALAGFIAADSWLNREGKTPVTGTAAIVSELEDFGRCSVMIPVNGGLSQAKDLAWFYGTIISGTRKENYLRVWVLRNGKWWVILQTIKA